jgi:hypothetical protein
MTPAASTRDMAPDLLTRPPNGTREFVGQWSHLMVDPVRQLATLADLYAMGLLSQDEYDRYKRHVRDL